MYFLEEQKMNIEELNNTQKLYKTYAARQEAERMLAQETLQRELEQHIPSNCHVVLHLVDDLPRISVLHLNYGEQREGLYLPSPINKIILEVGIEEVSVIGYEGKFQLNVAQKVTAALNELLYRK